MSADNNTPLGFSSYNAFDPSSFKDNPSLFEDSPYVRKLLDSTLSFDAKMEMAKQANLGKLAQLNGYRMGYILGADDEGAGVDPDSGLVQDAETGDTFRFRMKGASGNFDAVDNADVVAKSRNKLSYQPDYIAQITGKRVEDLTEFDFKNVKNYQTQEAFAAWKDPNHQFLPYDPNFVYAAPSAKQRIPVLYKSTGSGFYGRDLTDMINPATGRSMTFDAAANPYLNASFSLGDYEDNPRNRRRFEEFNTLKAEAMKDRVAIGANANEDALQDARDLAQIKNYNDNTNIFEQAYDKFAYAGQLAKHSFVSEFTKFISSDRAKKMGSESVFDVKGWQALDKQLSREDQLSSRGAIFRQLNREADKFYDNMQNEWGKGNYFASAKNALGFIADYVGMMPELIGQSAGQTGVGVAIGAAVGSAVPGAGTVGGAVAGLAASVLGQGAYTALSNSLETLENYKKANNGKEMPWDETLQMFGEYLAAASAEAGLDRMFLGRLFGRSKLGKKMFGKPSPILEGRGSLSSGAIAAAGEFPQEGWESTIDAYYSQKEGAGRQSRLELATSPEVVKQAVGGAVAGFGMGAGLTGLSNIGTGRSAKLFRQRVEATQKANDTQTYTGVDADQDESHTFMAGLNSTTLDDKLHNLQKAVITPESAHARAENIRKQLNNPKSLLSRTAYDAGTIEANQWDLATAQYYKDKGWSNDQIEKELGRSLEDIFGSVIHGSNLNTNKLYEQGLQLNEAQHAIEEETYTKIGKSLGLDEKFIRNTIEQTNNDARYGGSGYYTYRDRILDRLNRLRTESLTPESKAQYEDDIENNLTAMLRLYGDQARKIMTMTEGAEHLAATNDRQYETSWMLHDKGFVLNRTDLANNTYDADRGAYAIYRNALQDLKEIEKSFNSLLNAGLSKETESKVRAWLGENDTNNPRAIPDWGIANTLEQRFKAAGLSLNQKAKNESKFKGKAFNTDDLIHSLTYISRVDPKQDKSAKYNQEFQNLHYAINQSPEVVQKLKDTVNGWKNKTAKEKALAALDKVISFRDTVNANEAVRAKNHDPIVKDVIAQLDTIEKEYPNVYLEPGVDTSDTRQQKLIAQTKRYNTLMDLRNKLQSVIDNNNKDDLALRERLNNTAKELRKNMASLASGKQNQPTGEQGKFAAAKEFLKNFTASIKRRVDKAGLERELKKLQKKYDDSITKGHSKEITDRIQSQITVVQDRLAELNKPAEQPKPNPNPTPNPNPAPEAKPESEEVSEPDDPLTKQVKRSTDIAWLNELKANLEFSNKNNPNQANFIKLIDQRIETLNNAKVSSKASKLDESYNYGESDDIRRTTLYGTIASNLTKHKALKGKLKTAWIPYLLSDNIRDLLLSKETPAVKASIERVVKPAKELANKLSSEDLSTVIKNLLRGSIVAAIKNLQTQYNKEYKAAYTQALQDLSNSPTFKLAAGEYGKIDYNSLVEILGKENAKELRKRIPKAIAKKGEKGFTLDVIASNPDNDIALIRNTFGESPDEIASSLYTKFVLEEATLKSEAKSQALEAIKDLSEELYDLKIDPEGNAKAYIDDISKRLAEVSTLLQGRLDFMEGKDTEASKAFKAYARISHEDGSESTGRGGDGNSSTNPPAGDSRGSQTPNSGNASDTLQNGSESPQMGQGVQTPTETLQGQNRGLQGSSQGSLNVWYGTGENAQFSNLTERPFTYKNHSYLTVEHAYQTLKSGTFDAETYEKPWSAGKKFVGNKGTDTKNNVALMRDLIRASFDANPRAKAALVATGTTPFTHNNSKVDAFWQKEFPAALDYVRTYFSNQPGSNTQVVNVRNSGYGKKTNWVTNDTYYIYGGRNGDLSNKHSLGNPYELGSMSREEAIDRCWSDKEWLAKVDAFITDMKALKASNPKLKKIILGCWCAPEPCHLNLVAKRIQTEVFGNTTVTSQHNVNTNDNQGTTEDEEADFIPAEDFNNLDYSTISDEEMAEARRLFSKGKSKIIPNAYSKEMILDLTREKMADTSEEGVGYLLSENRALGDIEEKITFKRTDRAEKTSQKRRIVLRNQIKESSRDAECLLAYNYKLYSEQSSFDPNKKNIEIFREAANKVKFDPSQTANPKDAYYYLTSSTNDIDKKGNITYRESMIRKSPAMLLLYDTLLEFDRNGYLTNNPQFNFNDFVLTMADFSLREYLTNNDYERFFGGKYLDRTDLAKLFGENEDTLTYQDETDLREVVQGKFAKQPDGTVVQVREGGIPRSVMINGMGELMLRNMGIVENKESSNYGFFSALTTSLGAWMLDYGEQLGLYHLGEVETRKGGILKAPKIAVVSLNDDNLNAIKKTQTAFKGTITIPEDGGKPIRDNNGLNLFKNANSTLGNDPVWDGSTIKYTDKTVYVKNSGNLTEVSQFRKEVMETMANVKYSFDTDITDFLDEEIEDGKTGWDLLAKTMGYVDSSEFKYLSIDEQESVKGQNAAIEKQIEALKGGIKKQKQFMKNDAFQGIKFKQFWSKNGRIFIDSSNMNPQTMKLLRFTCLAEGMRYTYDPTLAKTDPIKFRELIQQENFAIAQAFDALDTAEATDKFSTAMKALSIEELKTLRKLLISNSKKEFQNKVKELGKTNEHFANLEGIGVESIPQALNALTHLIRRKEANGKAFTTSLVAENDSTTSGYVIKMLQFPMIEQMGGLDAFKALLEKVGVTLADGTLGDKNLLSIHELKKTKGFLDLYRTTAMAVSDYIDELQQKDNESKRIKVFTEAVGRDAKSTEGLDSKKLKEQNSDVAFLNHVFKEFKDALPKKDLKGKISGAFRELMKPATMVFGYSAGIESISRKLSETVMQDYVKVYTVLNLKYKGDIDNYIANEKPDHTKEEIVSIQAGMEAIKTQYQPKGNEPKSFLEVLQKKSYNKIILTVGGKPIPGANKNQPRVTTSYQISLDECFMHLIGNTYGKKAGEALEAIFEPYVKINNLMIEMSNTATDLYKRVYDDKVKELLATAKANNREVTSAEMQQLKDDLKELQPYLDLADNGYQIKRDGEIITNTSNMSLTKFERDQGENNLGANYYIRDGKIIDGSSTYGNERVPGYPVRAGAVIPIHCLDGAIMADVLSQYGKNGLTGIHDAIVMSAFQSNEISRYYNQRLFQRCKDYSIFQDMVDNFDRVCRVFSSKKYKHLIPNTNGNINDMLVASGRGKDKYVAKDFYTDPDTMERKAIPKTIYDLLKGYSTGKGRNKKTFIGVRELTRQISKAREDFYKMSFVIANLDSSGIQGSFLSQEDGELVSQWNSNLRHSNDKYNEDVTKTRTSLEAQEFLVDESEFFAQAFGKPELTDSEKASQVSSANNQEYVRGSGPRGYQTNGAIKNTYSRALESAEARVEALTDIQNLAKANGNRVCSDEQMARLQLLAGSIAPERVRGVALDVAENGRWSAGEYNSLTKHIQVVMDDKSAKTFLDPKTKLCAFSLLAPAEVYVHELLHAANDFAFAHRGVFGFNSQIRKLLVLQDEARKILTWKDFMPEEGTFDESVRKYYEQNAKEFYDYIFKEADPKTLDSLNEFCSFVATNENLRKKLQKATINQPTLATKANLVDRLISVLKNIYDVIFGRKKFSEAFIRSYKVLKGDSTGKTVSLLDEFDRLHRQLHTVTHKAVNPLLYHPLKVYETFLDITDSAIKTGNEKIHKALEGIFKYHDIRWEQAQEKVKQAQLKAKIARQNGDIKAEQEAKDEEREAIKEGAKHMPKYSLGINATKTDIIKLLGKLSKQVLTNGEARKQIRLALKELTKVSQQSVWMSTYRDFMGPDQGTATFEALGMKLRLVDKISKNQEATAMRVLQDSFGRPVTDYENTAITNSMLYTDLQCFYDGSNLSNIKELLRDSSVRKNLIQNTLAMFKQKLSARDYSWLQYSATSTAFNMVHGIGNPLLNLNAQGIAEGKGWDHSLNLSDKEIESLDKLITLYALENTSQEYLDITASLPEAGLEQFLKMHQEFVNESKNGYKDILDNGFIDNKPFIEATSVMKGYVKTLTDPSIDSVIAIPDPNDTDEFKKQGYDDKMVIPADGIVNTKDTHVYTRFGIPNRRDGNIVSVQGHQAMGKTIMQFAFSIEDDINSVRTNPLDEAAKKANALKRWKAMRKKADDQLVAIRNEVINRSKQSKEFTFDDIKKLTTKYSSFSPIYDNKTAGPRDYRQTLARDIKRQHLGLDERGLTILSRMFGSVARQIYGKAVNEQLLQFTIDYMQDNMTFMGNYDKQGHKFIKIEKDSPNKYLRDSWKVIPPNFKEYIKHHDLYIREDWLQDYFGVPNYTLLDNEKVKKHTGYLIKRGIAIAEMIMKTIAYARKQAIVLKIPGVLVGNIVSNLMFSIMNHRNPVKVIKATIANAQAIRDYIENRKVLDRILFKIRLGTVTKAETEQIPSLRRKLENNIVKPLMEKGMYQSIIEDMQSDELESIGKVNKWIKHNKILQKIPASLKTTFRTVFMMEGTPAYDFMFIATQYSDFVARCTEYQLSMDEVPAEYEKAKKDGTTKETFKQFNQRREKEISTEITNAFINYDKPQSQLEQYLNDLGLIMFSKFGKRIQSVIKNQMYRRPIHSILFLMSQLTFIDTEDILEQNMFNKNWLNLVHSPVENFIGAVVPMPLQILLGDQKAF